ncbi:diguanylate cyclase domain-containing protein [Blastococcus haudaquaticus]|uniref:PAS domain S-box-containing protein/diguanylate cyclase (GGDEF) domain-containing protein n=1 Tax=Blastococcus haudaquaticus TaxID=1938745 RepID=A0A286GXV2_9ACTN|nr:diguanylate cyclase [Blastococcus haudaquaticus]SOE00343.1 PAS domain S-box-containing protein/diguanylate cyclase (GGDEF) domain-containing protein [Blastococcus haudaquaticus]
MIGLRDIPRSVRWTVPLGLLGLALTVPFSAPDGTGMQWDEIVLGAVAASSSWEAFRIARPMARDAGRPWRILGYASLLFMTAQWLAAGFPGPELDGFGFDDVLLFAGATAPLLICGLLARRVRRTRWLALVVDGLVITVALLVVTEVLRTPLVNPADAPEDLRSLVLMYGAYGAAMLGGAGALCTVSTAALRRSASILIGAVAWQATAGVAEAMAIVDPSALWTAVSDVSVAMGLQTVVLAASFAPRRFADHTAKASAPVVSPIGMALVVGALLSLPVAIGLMEWREHSHSTAAEIGIAVVLTLMAVRLVLRMREDGRMTEDLVRSEEDFRELIEASSDGIAIMDGEFRLLFTSPAARSLLGLGADAEDEVCLLDLVDAGDRDAVRAGTLHVPGGDGPPLHFSVVRADGPSREIEATATERPGSGRRVLYLRDVTTRRHRERELERMAYTDHLTALPNRAMLFKELGTPSHDQRCLLVLDLDGFKAVNDVAGHEAGDQLLVEVARRLHTVVREDDLVARLGGDEFAVLVTGTLAEADDVARRVVDTLGMPHRTSDGAFAVGASVGVATIGAAGGQVAFREADAALREAKAAGKGCVRLAGVETANAGVESQPDFHDVVAEGVFAVRLDAACTPDGRIEWLHAVPTWSHPEHAEVRGLELWGFAERQGRAAELLTWLLHEATRAVAGLSAEDIGVAVSLPAGFATADGLAGEVAGALNASGLPAHRLLLSFTEETLLTASAALVPELEAVRRSGVKLCLDNYGMGHSLFALLARVPLDMVRVDVAALASRDDTGRAMQVFSAILRTTKDFGLIAIAGGISTPALHAAVLDTGVELLNGRTQPHDLTIDDVAALVAVPAVG